MKNIPDQCSKCGGPIRWDKSSNFIECSYCGKIVFLESKISSNYDDFFSGHGKILILKNDLINISSSEVRHKIKSNENLSEMVDDQVLEYISKKSLYKI